MERSRTKSATLIVLFSFIRQFSTIIVQFVSRTVFIIVLNAEYLGLNGLFSNILSFLALSELGISSAITFWLYKPLSDGDKDRIQAVVTFYAICYRVVGFIIIVLGCLLIPLLPRLVNFKETLPVNLFAVYILYLLNTASTYLLFAYKGSIFIADQKQDTLEGVNITFNIIGCLVDVVLLVAFRAFLPYLCGKLCLTVIRNLTVAKLADKAYPYLVSHGNKKLGTMEIRLFFKELYHVFIFNVGSQLQNISETIIISLLLGTIVVGYYSNYNMIFTQISGIYALFVSSISAGVGQIFATESKERAYLLYRQLSFFGFCLTMLLSICTLFTINPFVELWIGGLNKNYIFPQSLIVLFVLNMYVSLCAQVLNTFRVSSGHFKSGSYLQIISGIVKVILAVIMGIRWGIVGILIATAISKWAIAILPFCYVNGIAIFGINGWLIVYDFLKQLFVTGFVAVVVYIACSLLPTYGVLSLFARGTVSIVVSLVLLYLFYHRTDEFKQLCDRAQRILHKSRIKK